MKICHVNLAKGFRGGERQTQLLIESLAKQTVEQALVARYDSPLHQKLAGTPGLVLYPVSKPYAKHLPLVKRFQPDLIHAHDAKAGQWSLLNHYLNRTPYVITRRISKSPKNVIFTRAVYRNVTRVVALSNAVKVSLQQLTPHLEVDVIPSMYASLPANQTQVQVLRQQYADYFVIGHIGALVNPHKGQAVLINAIKVLNEKHKNFRFLLLGSGKDEALLKRLAMGVPNIEFIGFVDDIGSWISIFDLFVFPSIEEGLGSTFLDVMQYEKPIVASGVGGILDVIKDRYNGILVPPSDAESLAAAIEEMYLKPDFRQRCVEAGRQELHKYSPEGIAQCYYEIYQSVLDAA